MKIKTYGIIGIIALFFVVFIVGITGIVIGSEVYKVMTEQPNKIAQININYEISDVRQEQSLFGPAPNPTSDDIIAQIKAANSRKDIRAIVLNIDSPGGEVIASREVYEAVIASEKPVVAYIRKTGASGAYYIAVGSDYIVSEPEALTGSIGVRIGSFVTLEKMFENLGINYSSVTSGDKKDMGDIGRDMTTEEVEILQEIVDQIFYNFKDAVYQNRKRKPRFNEISFENVTDGRIISGKTAYNLGLVDELGNRESAFEKAKELAGLENYEIIEIDRSESSKFFGKFTEELIKPINIGITVEHKIINENKLFT